MMLVYYDALDYWIVWVYLHQLTWQFSRTKESRNAIDCIDCWTTNPKKGRSFQFQRTPTWW